MRHLLVVSMLHLVVSCGGSPTSPATSSSAAPPKVYGCKEDEVARAACAAKGASFSYQADPPRNCSGVKGGNDQAPETDGPCVCIEASEVDRLFKECSEAN